MPLPSPGSLQAAPAHAVGLRMGFLIGSSLRVGRTLDFALASAKAPTENPSSEALGEDHTEAATVVGTLLSLLRIRLGKGIISGDCAVHSESLGA